MPTPHHPPWFGRHRQPLSEEGAEAAHKQRGKCPMQLRRLAGTAAGKEGRGTGPPHAGPAPRHLAQITAGDGRTPRNAGEGAILWANIFLGSLDEWVGVEVLGHCAHTLRTTVALHSGRHTLPPLIERERGGKEQGILRFAPIHSKAPKSVGSQGRQTRRATHERHCRVTPHPPEGAVEPGREPYRLRWSEVGVGVGCSWRLARSNAM